MDRTLTTRTWHTVPDIAFADDVPLVAVERGGYVGSLHRGSAALVNDNAETVLNLGDENCHVFLRSAAKPFQVMPAVIGGAIERFGITDPELAVLCASHSGEPRHVDAVRSLLAKAGLDESYLRCGTHPPIDQQEANRLIRENREATPVYNNCSGAHTGMLLACRAYGWDLENYGSAEHPLQRMTSDILAQFAGLSRAHLEFARDNCAVPAFRLSLRHAALAFSRLGTGSGVQPQLADAARRVRQAMMEHPEMVAGDHRFDTDLMRAGAGHIVAKGGAEGFMGVSLPIQRLGLGLKISDGNPRAIPPAVLRILDRVDAIPECKAASLEQYRRPEQRDLREQLVGHVTAVFEPDYAG